MALCAQSDIVLEIGTSLLTQLCSDGTGVIDSSIVADRIARADADALSILGPQFDVDEVSASIADVVKYAAVDLTVAYMYERKPEFRRGPDGVNPEKVRYDRAIKTLHEIADGKRDMGREDDPTTSAAAVGGTVYASTTAFILDPDEASDGPTGGY